MEPPVPGLEPGYEVDLPGRGTTWVRDLPGPRPDSPTVLLLHGWTVTADVNWSTSYRALQRRFRVLAMDHRGHGRGIRSRRPFRLEDCADDAAALCHELGVGRIVACGYSMGGPVAQLAWRRHPDLVSGLVLCATGRRFGSDPQRARILAVSLLGASVATRVASPLVLGRLVGRYLDARLGDDPALAWAGEQMRGHDPAAILQAGAALASFDSRSWIGGVDVPTAVVVTTHDQTVVVRRQRNLAAAIPGAVVEEVDGGHAVVVEAPDRFVPALLRACTHASAALAPVLRAAGADGLRTEPG
ncbi:MAG: alpha/beta hydrolase [Acidimicrobiales bacterium]